ncbi:hypothetical protein DRW48_02460 [Paracoccus suum]|uniref:HdeD family acid-resistance protein n=1 Tax=Paracoccus suum TaxID=2259340 RepID=A0A344PH47_9RHOB|nr:DUF308 domain-containing protein [Paracoccus suum]AXC48702.1 hypothetical protein DRW48_02460 [Paracoccus suum]
MRSSTLMIVAGVLSLLAGLVALVFPLPASLAVTVLTGWAFLISGVLGLWAAFSNETLQHRGWVGAIGVLNMVVGVWMLANPLAGMISLTVVVGAMLLASGVARIVGGFGPYKGTQMQWMMVLSGIISVALGIYIIAALPVSSIVTLGILVAIELIVVGVTLTSAGITLRRTRTL